MKAFTEIRDAAEYILEDTGNVLWSTAVLDNLIRECLRELSDYIPLDERETVYARDDSYEIDISGLSDLIRIREGEWEVDQTPRSFIDVKQITQDRALLSLITAPSAHSDDELTGTVTFTSASKSISGSGTAFTTELVVGDYIKKSSGSDWYRVAFITSDTALTLASEVESDDDGADTEDATDLWHSPVYLYCDKVHRLNEMTDLAGAVKTAVSNDARTMTVDGLQSAGTIKKGTKFTLSDTDGIYRVTADATIASNEATIYFTPGLATDAAEDEVVTFETSTLTSTLERLLAELVAARATLYWVGKGRDELTSAVDAADSAASSLVDMTSKISQSVADLVSARTAAGLIAAAVIGANSDFGEEDARLAQALNKIISGGIEVTKIPSLVAEADALINAMSAMNARAITDIDSARTENDKTVDLISSANTAIGKIDNTVKLAINSLMASQGYINTVPVGDSPDARLMALGNRFLDIVAGYQAEAQSYMQQAAADETVSREYTSLAMGELSASNGKLNEARGKISLINADEASAASYANLAIAEIRVAAEHRQKGMAQLQKAQADALESRTFEGIASGELTAARADLNQAIAYIRELMGRLSTARTILQYKESARRDLGNVHNELKSICKPRQKIYHGVS